MPEKSTRVPVAYERTVEVLDSLIRRLISTGWDEKLRQQAQERAAWLATFGSTDAPKQARAIGRGLVSLLSLRDDAGLRPLLGQRLLELLERLRDSAPAEDVASIR